MPHFCRFFRFFLGGRVAGQDNKPVPSGHLVSAWWVPIGHLWQNAPRLSLLRDRIETIMEISKIILIFATCSRRYFSPMASVYLSEYMNVSSYSGRLDFTRRYSMLATLTVRKCLQKSGRLWFVPTGEVLHVTRPYLSTG